MATAEHDIIRYARVLPPDIVQAKGNGHAGTAASLAPLMTLLFGTHLRDDPADAAWAGRDRFVLSAGHAALVLYVQLYLSGYGLTLDDLRRTRRLGSLTPGHPERGVTNGVETSTGPLGQGIGNAVGLAMDQRRQQQLFDPDGGPSSPFAHRVWCVAGDGDLMEGISHEAASLAGHLGLGNLVILWDDNGITIEGGTDITWTEDVAARFAAYGFRVLEVADGEDLAALDATLTSAAAADPLGPPTFVRVRTRIGHPLPHVGGTARAHAGAPGEDEIRAAKQILGLDPDEQFAMPADLLERVRAGRAERGAARHRAWERDLAAWRADAPAERVALLDRLAAGALPEGLWDDLPVFEEPSLPIRSATAGYLAALAARLPELWGGSADLADTAGGRLTASDNFLRPADASGRPGSPGGQQVHYGVREHAMAAISNGIALGGLSRPFANGYLVFADYLRPSLRLAALMGLPVLYSLTHDSIAVGEDGPTHQPVEHVSSLRLIPGVDVVRPADADEVLGALRRILERPEGPAVVVSSRQAVPRLGLGDAAVAGAQRGGYVVRAEEHPDVVLLATGSEVSLALAAADLLAASGRRVQVSSLPCWEWFEQQPDAYREPVVRPDVPARVAVEAGSGALWWKYVGPLGAVVSVEDFGHSGDGAELLRRAGLTPENVAAVATQTWERTTPA
ncbi:transketolase [Propioniciclava coleopterorum]|uniref:transketolase n=1 Tax=Propioniciclava coleopterorum TaxID=2714937 RepID=A0A6G7Y3M0_9ACTN|nr:transketolase [Propioniciclava coleopterorum]QIK71276.1 transketolase [Propioniciclava coleopterorum]